MTRLTDLAQELTRGTAPAVSDNTTDPYSLLAHARDLQARALVRLLAQGARTLRQDIGAVRRSAGAHLLPAIQRIIRRRRTIAALDALEDRVLEDIGVRRADIAAIAARLAQPAPRPRRPGLLEAWRKMRARRAAIGELERLPDYVLNDIGLQRDQIVPTVDAILARQRPAATTATPQPSAVDGLRKQLDEALRPLRQWQLSRVAAGQIARLDPETLRDLGYVKGDVDWVPEVMAERTLGSDRVRVA